MLRLAQDSSVYDGEGEASDTPHTADWNDRDSIGTLCEYMIAHQDDQMGRVLEKFLRNIAWLAGDQYLRYNAAVRAMTHPDRDTVPAWRIRLVFNILYPTAESRIARLVRDKPWWQTRPATCDEYDIAVARMQRNLLASYHYFLKMPLKTRRAIMWGMCCGLVGWKVYWDTMAGNPLTIGSDSLSPQLMAELQQMKPPGGGVMYPGDVAVGVVPAIDTLFYPLSITDVEDRVVTLHRRECEAVRIADQYEMTVAEVLRHGREGVNDSPRERASVYGSSGGGGALARQSDNAIVQVCELWRIPYGQQPRGAMGVVLGRDHCIKVQPNPYPNVDDCFVWMQEKPVPNSLHGTCTMSEMISSQQEVNRDISTMAEYRNTVARGKWARVHGDQMEPLLDDSPHQVVKVRGRDFFPQRLDPPQLGPHLNETRQEVNRLADYIGGVSDASKGRVPPGARAARTVELLQSADDDRLSIYAAELNEVMGEIGSRIIETCQEFAPDERIARIIGDTNAPELITWNRYKIRNSLHGKAGIERSVDVFVTDFTRLAMSKPAQREMLKELADAMSKVQDPVLRQKLLVAWDMGDELQILEDDRRHRARQMREINELRMGRPIKVPGVSDSDIVHVEVIDKWIDSDDYDQVVGDFPWVEQVIKVHREQHLQNAEDKRVSDEYRIVLARNRMFQKYSILSQGMFTMPLSQGGVDGTDSANRPGERGGGARGAKGKVVPGGQGRPGQNSGASPQGGPGPQPQPSLPGGQNNAAGASPQTASLPM